MFNSAIQGTFIYLFYLSWDAYWNVYFVNLSMTMSNSFYSSYIWEEMVFPCLLSCNRYSLKAQENYLLIFWQWHSFHHYMGPSYFCLAICFNFLGVNASACDRIDFVKNRALSFSCTSYILITLRIIKLKIQLCSFTCSR